MSDIKIFFNKCKEVFTSNRSMSMPTPTAEDSEFSNNVLETKRTLRRSRSGRVKAMTRTRSMVSTFDFNISEQEGLCEKQGAARTDQIDSSMLKRMERIWPGMEEEDPRNSESKDKSELK